MGRVGSVSSVGHDMYHEQVGEGVPILLIHPSGSTASTWGSVVDELARIGQVITYDRRGYARTGGEPVRKVSTHTADAAALLEHLGTAPAVVVGTSSGAMIAIDLAVRRPDLVRAVIEHEGPWRFTRHVPPTPQMRAIARIGSLVLRGRPSDAAEALLRSAYSYRDGGTAWDAFPEQWRRAGRETRRRPCGTSSPRSATTRPRRTSRPSGCPSSAATAHAVRTSWSAAPDRSPPPSRERVCVGSKGPPTQPHSMQRPTS